MGSEQCDPGLAHLPIKTSIKKKHQRKRGADVQREAKEHQNDAQELAFPCLSGYKIYSTGEGMGKSIV